ncbi:hypothetical protein [Ideonella sp. A 288]|uniref:hypothetical protein n=1 Tax=Ideonella sp. A 288 TaxID=1962181 RepID=UPI000B4AC131|nr:hypothetical protein [Ideonella sp. A 288]
MDITQPSTPHAMSSSALTRQALQLAVRVLELAKVYRKPHDMSQATAQVARCLKAMRDFGSAEAYLNESLAWTALIHGQDARVDVLCELAEVACTLAEMLEDDEAADAPRGGSQADIRRGARERARDRAFEAAQLASQTTDAHWEVKVLLRVSDVLNRCGDHDDAATLQDRAITLLGLQPDADSAADAPADALRMKASHLLM